MGRPSSFRPEFVEQARKLCELGATDLELADFFEVDVRTIYRWQAQQDAFCHALKAGKVAADERVTRSLYHRACGYTHDAVKIFQHQGEPVRVPYREHVPPDTTAAIFWLKNRRPEEWRDRHNHEITGKNGGAIEVTDTAAVELARRVAFLLARAAHEPALIEAEATEAEGTEAET